MKRAFQKVQREMMTTLPNFIEIGQANLGKLINLMNQFRIPYSGPYRVAGSVNGKDLEKVCLFVSDIYASDNLINNSLPLYGIYEFRTTALNIRDREDRDAFVKGLPRLPGWLEFIPPIFDKSFEELCEQLNIE